MGNHTIDCEVCGEDKRAYACAKDCPGEKAPYIKKLDFWKKHKLLRAYWVKKQLRSKL